MRRMEALHRAIEERDWFGTEFAYDQVHRALTKADETPQDAEQ